MNILAFDSGTAHLSVALRRDDATGPALFKYDGAGGAAASASLIPTVLALLGQAGLRLGQLDTIAFGAGPGSFTGLRTACAVAQGLAYGAGLPVLAIDSLLAVAEDARQHRPPALQDQPFDVLAVLDARMGEVYAGAYRYAAGHWRALGHAVACPPQALGAHAAAWAAAATEELAPAYPIGWTVAGNAWTTYGPRLLTDLPAGTAFMSASPSASALLALAPALWASGHAVPAAMAQPRYIRDKVAQTTEERAASIAASSPPRSPTSPLSPTSPP